MNCLKFCETLSQAAVPCCGFYGVRSVANLPLLETPAIQQSRFGQYLNIDFSETNLFDLPVTLAVTDPSSQQSPLQSHPPPPKRSDKEVIFGYLTQGSIEIDPGWFSQGQTCFHSPQEEIFCEHESAEATVPKYEKQTASLFPEIKSNQIWQKYKFQVMHLEVGIAESFFCTWPFLGIPPQHILH